MTHQSFDELLTAAQSRQSSRRDLLKQAMALGLSAPAIAAILAACGGDDDDDASTPAETESSSGGAETETSETEAETEAETSTEAETEAADSAGTETEAEGEETEAEQSGGERGGGGTLQILWWQSPVMLNGHLSVAGKDIGAISICQEPLAYFDANSELVPFLAAEIPTVENGGLAEDRTSVTWKLREGVKWHDGEDFTADDVVFTFEYLSDPATNATTLGFYETVESVERIDDYTVQVNFKNPVAAWFDVFVGSGGMILPEHVLRDYIGEDAVNAPFNLMPIGTGPFKVVDFNPGDMAVYEIHTEYWDPGKPFFDGVVLKGGGDAVSAARAVMQTGEADWAWNLQVEATVLESLQAGNQGKLVTWPGAGTEKLVINHTDPETEKDGQRSHRDVPHPHLSDLRVRQAIALSIPRGDMAEQLYGEAGEATGYTLNESPDYMPPGITWEIDLERANQLLDEAGATPLEEGKVRELNGRAMEWVSSASLNTLRQKEQELLKSAFSKLGIGLEIAAIDGSVYFDAANESSFQHLYFDFGIERNSSGIYPMRWYLRYLSADPLEDLPQKENGWSGRNFGRYQNPKFNELFAQAIAEADEEKYIPIFWEMQQLVVDDVADIGMVSTNDVAAAAADLTGYEPSPFAIDVWDIRNWRRG